VAVQFVNGSVTARRGSSARRTGGGSDTAVRDSGSSPPLQLTRWLDGEAGLARPPSGRHHLSNRAR